MKLGIIADDFTGASDIANTLSREGMAVTQYVGVPKIAADKVCEAGVVSLKSRTVPAQEAVDLSVKALDWLLAQGATQIIFKYCSTFDSTEAGNIGVVAEALLKALGETKTIFCPAFPANGRSVYQGHLFVKDRLLNESGMENHPLTPMKDADLRRVLQSQTRLNVGHLAFDLVDQGPHAISAALDQLETPFIIADAISEKNLRDLGKACASLKLITGGSGIALGLPQNFTLSQKAESFSGASGYGLALSGSCSIASQKQVAVYSQNHPAMMLDADALMAGRVRLDDVMAFIKNNLIASPLIYSTSNPLAVKKAQQTYGAAVIAEKFEHFFGEIARGAQALGVKRLVVGGGETSGAVVQALQIETFQMGQEIAAGVPAMITNHGLRIALKSGNFGQDDFFERALKVLGGNA